MSKKQKSPLKVKREYRTHPLSKTDGGVTVVVVRKDGTTLEYTDVKMPERFIHAVWRNDGGCTIVSAHVKETGEQLSLDFGSGPNNDAPPPTEADIPPWVR